MTDDARYSLPDGVDPSLRDIAPRFPGIVWQSQEGLHETGPAADETGDRRDLKNEKSYSRRIIWRAAM